MECRKFRMRHLHSKGELSPSIPSLYFLRQLLRLLLNASFWIHAVNLAIRNLPANYRHHKIKKFLWLLLILEAKVIKLLIINSLEITSNHMVLDEFQHCEKVDSFRKFRPVKLAKMKKVTNYLVAIKKKHIK